jgi:hypothetical protein
MVEGVKDKVEMVCGIVERRAESSLGANWFREAQAEWI